MNPNTELKIQRELKEKGYKYVVQFQEKGKDWGEPLTFKTSAEIGPFMRENPEFTMAWTRTVDHYITILNEMNTKPRFTHDCYVCSFLGQYKEFDLYFCSRGSLVDTTVIARFSSEGGDYASGLTFGVTGGNIEDNSNVSKLKVALYRALLFPEFKQKIIEYFETFEKDFPERQKRFKELLLISETDPKDYPTLLGSLSDYGLRFIETYFREAAEHETSD